MKRYYSHYTYIHPDIYLRNHIVELDDIHRISRYFPFEKEIEMTEFYSGLILFVPLSIKMDKSKIEAIIQNCLTAYSLPSFSCISEIDVHEK